MRGFIAFFLYDMFRAYSIASLASSHTSLRIGSRGDFSYFIYVVNIYPPLCVHLTASIASLALSRGGHKRAN